MKLARDLSSATAFLHPRETLFSSGNPIALNSEVICPVDGCTTISVDLRGSGLGTYTLEGACDATAAGVPVNYQPIPVRQINVNTPQKILTWNTAGTYVANVAGYRHVRVRCTVAGTNATVVIQGHAEVMDRPQTADFSVTTLGTVNTATTCSLGAVPGLRHYVTGISIQRFATALLTAGAAPINVTTTNLPGSPAFSFAADALAAGGLDRMREEYSFPLAATALGSATTIVAPATPNVIWRITAGYYLDL